MFGFLGEKLIPSISTSLSAYGAAGAARNRGGGSFDAQHQIPACAPFGTDRGRDQRAISVYKHNELLLKEVGDHVVAGEAIALVGNTGELSTGPHLHFELWYRNL